VWSARGAPVTLARLVRVARANGVTLDIDERGCKEPERIQTSADATNLGPPGLERRQSVYRREGEVLCTVVRAPHAHNREVEVVKYPTDTETQVGDLNVGCDVYPFIRVTDVTVRARCPLGALRRELNWRR